MTLENAPDRFPGPADFAGDYSPRPGPAWNGLQSTYSGAVVVTMVDADVVREILPPGLSLALRNNALPGVASMHPVVHLIGRQGAPSTLWWGYSTQVGEGYEEMILLVPFVVRDSGTRWHNYVVRMYLDSQIAVDGGNEFFGYAKQLADLLRTTSTILDRHEVVSPDRATVWFNSEIDVPSQWSTLPGVASMLPRWGEIQEILSMPVLGLRPADILQPANIARPALWICSYWELDFATAELAPTRSAHQWVTRVVSGMADWENLGILSSAPDGAVAMRNVRWRLALPPQGC